MSVKLFEIIEPTNDALFNLAYRHVDDSMLREIAEADYGSQADAHLKALLAIKAGEIPVPMQWEPQEVLELVRWSEPEALTSDPGSVETRQHWMRLLSCAILIRVAAEPKNAGYFLGEESTIIQLVESAMKLGEETSLTTLQFLCWRMQYRRLDEWDRPFFAVAILLLSVSLDVCDSQTAEYLIAAAHSDVVAVSQLCDDCQRAQKWKEIARRILCESIASSHDLQRFGHVLIGGANTG